MKRSSGILLHISSLPSPYGVGTFGRAAYEWVDLLVRAHQSLWQVLPLGQTSYGDSPYQCFSAFAGNPYFIDLEFLADDGLLDRDILNGIDWGVSQRQTDYGKLYTHRFRVLRGAFERAREDDGRMNALDAFAADNASWLNDYALFMALKDENGGCSWQLWPDALRMREESVLADARVRLQDGIRFYQFLQQLFFEQWQKLKAYANERGVRILGDLPIYVPLDSADVWSAPQEFQLDESRRPLRVAGVPPDYFTADGQLWGNPLYNWEYMRQNGYDWWKRRMRAAASLFDCLRFDHFRGLSSYWSVDAAEKTARIGEWIQGPGDEFVTIVKQTLPGIDIIAEDLGYLNDDVRALLANSGFPGMKVLEFAFDTREPNDYLPHTYTRHCVCYTGTHDNTTAAGWLSQAASEDAAYAAAYFGLHEEEGYAWGFLRGGMSSVANLFIAQAQDYLGLGSEFRMNTPGTLGGGNWRWRLLPGEFGVGLADRIADLTRMYGRG
jgi:4-alpha-glucanotransferase